MSKGFECDAEGEFPVEVRLFEVDVGKVMVELVVYVAYEGACCFRHESLRSERVEYDGFVELVWGGHSKEGGAELDCGFP